MRSRHDYLFEPTSRKPHLLQIEVSTFYSNSLTMIQQTRSRLATMSTLSYGKQGPMPIRKTRLAKKSVRFSSTCQVVTLQSSTKEPRKSWYAKKEYSSFRSHCKQDVVAFVRAMKAGSYDSTEHCVRGLETYFPPTRKQACDQRKKQRLHAVLGHQFMQRSMGAYDPESLAFVSNMLSRNSCQKAVEMGRRDAMVWIQP